MAEHAEDTRVKDALELLNSYARDKRLDLQNLVTNKYSDLKAAIGSFGGKLSHDATELYHAGKERAVAMAQDLDQNVHKHPWPYIGGAALGALILGYLLGRSQR